jgi:Na+/melibiose symporter-like transporter
VQASFFFFFIRYLLGKEEEEETIGVFGYAVTQVTRYYTVSGGKSLFHHWFFPC